MPSRIARRVLLVGLSGFDWRRIAPLLEQGLLPHLAGLIDTGVLSDVPTLQPAGVAPAAWTSIATGVRAYRHGILGDWSIVGDDAPHAVRPSGPSTRQSPAVWSVVAAMGGRAHVVNWPVTHPAEATGGLFVSSRGPGNGGRAGDRTFALPADLAGLLPEHAGALPGLQVQPADVPADVLRLFAPRRAAPGFPGDPGFAALRAVLADCFTVHNYTTLALELGDWDLCACFYPLIGEICRAFLPLAVGRSASEEESGGSGPEAVTVAVSDIVSGAYRLIDLLLGRLLQLAGPESAVLLIGDHGFSGGAPGVPVRLGERGFLLLRGPGLKRDERIYRAGLLDVAPTALALLGFPVPAGIPGRVLADAFLTLPDVAEAAVSETAPTHAEISGAAASDTDAAAGLDPVAVTKIRRENDWNLTRALVDGGRADLALPVLWRLHQDEPVWGDVAICLADGLCTVGMPLAAHQFLRTMAGVEQDPVYLYQLGVAARDAGREQEAMDHLRAAEVAAARGAADAATLPASFYTRVAYVYLRSRRIPDALRVYSRVTKLYPEEPIAWLGRAASTMFDLRMEEAVVYARRAISLQHDLPLAHLVLARSLYALRQMDEAFRVCETALALSSQMDEVHAILARLYAARPDGEADATRHRRLAREIRERRARAAQEGVRRRRALHDAVDGIRRVTAGVGAGGGDQL